MYITSAYTCEKNSKGIPVMSASRSTHSLRFLSLFLLLCRELVQIYIQIRTIRSSEFSIQQKAITATNKARWKNKNKSKLDANSRKIQHLRYYSIFLKKSIHQLLLVQILKRSDSWVEQHLLSYRTCFVFLASIGN